MRWTDMYIAATGVHVPGWEDTALAVADGRYDPDEALANAFTRIGVARGVAPPEMAVVAGRTAVGRAGVCAGDVGLVLHASFHHQGMDHWTPASYVHREVVGGRAPAVEVRQGSNGGMAALLLGMSFLTTQPPGVAVLATTSDSFGPPVYDRYRSEKWFVLADGATAAVLTRTGGFARVVSTAVDADPGLEAMYRDADGYSTAPLRGRLPLDLRVRKSRFLAEEDGEAVAARVILGVRNVVATALADAGLAREDIAWFVFPNVGLALLRWQVLDVLGVSLARTTWEWGRAVGHLGAGDQVGGLDYLVTSGRLRAGDRVALVGSGIGFTWSCAVLEVAGPAPSSAANSPSSSGTR